MIESFLPNRTIANMESMSMSTTSLGSNMMEGRVKGLLRGCVSHNVNDLIACNRKAIVEAIVALELAFAYPKPATNGLLYILSIVITA